MDVGYGWGDVDNGRFKLCKAKTRMYTKTKNIKQTRSTGKRGCECRGMCVQKCDEEIKRLVDFGGGRRRKTLDGS